MTDQRVVACLQAARAMSQGNLHPELELDGEDVVAQLGQALSDLGSFLDTKFSELDQLAKVTMSLNSGVALEEVLDYVYENFQLLIPYDRIGFALLEDDDRVLRAHWARTGAKEAFLGKGYQAPMKGSTLQPLLATKRIRILNDLEKYLERHPESDSTRRIVREGFKSSLTCPLISFQGAMGFMFFSSFEANTYDHVHVAVFQQLAGQLAAILAKSRMHDELARLNEQKDKFMGIAAHDLRNPAMIIQGYAEVLRSGALGEVNEEQREVAESIELEARRIHELVSSLLDTRAIQSGHLELAVQPTNLGELVRRRVRANEVVARGKQIELVAEIPEEVPLLELDKKRMGQVLDNLITNACKYSESETKTTVSIEVNPDGVALRVRDQGLGIPASELDRLFQEFGRTSVVPTGGEKSLGLGLAIVRRIVEAHGATISCESQPGSGSTFSVQFPRVT